MASSRWPLSWSWNRVRLALPRHIARPSLDLDSQLGLGQAQLLDDLTVNGLLPEDWLIGYSQGKVTWRCALPLIDTRPTPILTEN
jgi:hypothetical protein